MSKTTKVNCTTDADCPLYKHYKAHFADKIAQLRAKNADIAEYIIVCNMLCPEVIGNRELDDQGRCLVKLRLLGVES